MTNDEKLELLADVFDVDVSEIKPDLTLDEMETWDSMTKLALVALADSKFHKSLKKETIATFKNVQDILNYLG